jgi:hypothetical protein
MVKYYKQAGVFFFIILLSSCDPCLNERTCSDIFSFKIVDKISKQDLVFGFTPVYRADSVFLTTKLPGYLGPMSYADSVKKNFNSRLVIPVDTFFLKIGSGDIDTLSMTYEYVKSKCCNYTEKGYGQIRGIIFNGILATKEGDNYIFYK